MKKFYLTTPIYYINSIPTVGSAYTTIIADILARWHRLSGKVFYLTGLDENSIKTVKAAKEKGYEDIQKYTNDMAEQWKKTWKILNINYDGFIRTTESRHKKIVREFFSKMYKKGDIYKGKYEGLYCDDCEAYLNESDLVNDLCPNHKKKPNFISEENYFFKLSKYQDKILKYIEKNPKFLLPESRKKEIINFIKSGLKDISISRQNAKWGIVLNKKENQIAWCWFDAVLNYVSGAEGNWPADLHLIGKDITIFHSIYFIGFLLSRWDETKLPKQIFAHGFFTVNGQKISKSLGNSIDPVYFSKKYSTDALRYYLAREIPFGDDGDFSEDALKSRINNELANELGNLVNRTLTLVEKKLNNKVKKGKIELNLDVKNVEDYMKKLELHNALSEIFKFISECNKYINDNEIWKLEKKELEIKLYNLLEALRIINILLNSFIPETSEIINKQLNIKSGKLEDCKFGVIKNYNIKKGDILFKKVE